MTSTVEKKMKVVSLLLLLCLSLTLIILPVPASSEPTPAPWPLQFHSTQVLNSSAGLLQINELWYDWPNGRNLNIIYKQLGEIIYDVEWDNGTSYYISTKQKQCSTMYFPVGILRPNFLDGANYLGQRQKDGFLCNVWEKVGFIWYYEDVATNRPVSWTFYSGLRTEVITFEVGKVLDDSNWQAPAYCFQEPNLNQHHPLLPQSPFALIREMSSLFRTK